MRLLSGPLVTATGLLLYEAPDSPHAQTFKIALREIGVPFALETPDGLGTGRTDDALGGGNPRAKVQPLVDGPTRHSCPPIPPPAPSRG